MARARLRGYHQGGACDGWAVILRWCSGVTENEDEKWVRSRGIHGIPRDIPGPERHSFECSARPCRHKVRDSKVGRLSSVCALCQLMILRTEVSWNTDLAYNC